jgi:hypothetical protein
MQQVLAPVVEFQSPVRDTCKGDISAKAINYDVYSMYSTIDSHTREGNINA